MWLHDLAWAGGGLWVLVVLALLPRVAEYEGEETLSLVALAIWPIMVLATVLIVAAIWLTFAVSVATKPARRWLAGVFCL